MKTSRKLRKAKRILKKHVSAASLKVLFFLAEFLQQVRGP